MLCEIIPETHLSRTVGKMKSYNCGHWNSVPINKLNGFLSSFYPFQNFFLTMHRHDFNPIVCRAEKRGRWKNEEDCVLELFTPDDSSRSVSNLYEVKKHHVPVFWRTNSVRIVIYLYPDSYYATFCCL